MRLRGDAGQASTHVSSGGGGPSCGWSPTMPSGKRPAVKSAAAGRGSPARGPGAAVRASPRSDQIVPSSRAAAVRGPSLPPIRARRVARRDGRRGCQQRGRRPPRGARYPCVSRGRLASAARGPAYPHDGRETSRLGSNVVIGEDGRARLTQIWIGGARSVQLRRRGRSAGPRLPAPAVARGEEQGGLAADVRAVACSFIATATVPVPRRGATSSWPLARSPTGPDAVPEVPAWLSTEAKDFMGM
ncbi:hypothetical protein C2845_PM08G22930 [Panicum miliaceum]|uniref:Uncharacterized protein n=1 Tax=Panicum miliaceum TaxID=4540 RepID=A0A3L6R0N6_PANMI|nr:hypothetical protein C2845_PM08G22930 [Panicum miliaceum]